MKLKKILLVFAIFMFCLFLSNNVMAASGSLNLEKLDFDITLNKDGSINVVETWKIEIEKTNTLFKTFGTSDMGGRTLTDVSVSEITGGVEVPFTKTNSYAYQVTKGYFYALSNSSTKNNFEIAWGIDLRNTTRTYKISYKVANAITNYSDCSELYYKVLGSNFEIPADRVTGTVHIPSGITNKENIRAWAHGPLNGDISIDSTKQVSFNVSYLLANQMLELRIVTLDKNLYTGGINKTTTSKFQSILSEEENWANQSNQIRKDAQEKLEQEEKTKKMVETVYFIATVLVGIFLIYKVYKYYLKLKETVKITPTQELDYFREMPDETATPADAAFLYYFKNGGMGNNLSKVMSATLLDLCMKKCLKFEVTTNEKNKEEIKVILIGKDLENSLPENEKEIYNLLEKIAGSSKKSNTLPEINSENEQSFTIKYIEKYAKNHSEVFINTIKKLETKGKESQEEKKNYDENLINQSTNWKGKMILYIVAGFIFGFAIIPGAICAILCYMIGQRYNTLTQKGVDEKEKWVGLKKYMEDFSLLNEREVPELAIWEKYLVFATTFGIADKVLKQLKIKYPQLMDETYMNTYGYSYMYLMYNHRLNDAFVTSLNNSVNRAYQGGVSASAVRNGYSYGNYSSGGGFGGGFSGGGGGGFGGGGGRR